MTEFCSVCALQSPSKLTPLFTKNGNHWQRTGLSEMLETVLDRKILKGRESVLAICIKCNYKISKLYHENTSMPVENIFDFLTKEIPALAAVIKEENFQAGMSPLNNPPLKKVDGASSVLVDDEKTNQKLQLKTTDELKVIKFEMKETINYFNSLPLECITKIFMFLSLPDRLQLERACKRCRDANIIAWQNMKELDFYKDLYPLDGGKSKETGKQILSRCGRFLEKLKVDCKISDSNFISVVNKYCHNLKEIAVILPDSPTKDYSFFSFSNMKILKEIQMSTYYYDEIPLNLVDIFSTLTTGLEKMEIVNNFDDLRLYPEYSVSRVPLHTNSQCAFDKFYALKRLSLQGLELDDDAMIGILKIKTLVELKLVNCEFSRDAELTENLPNLEILEFNNEHYCLNLLNLINCCRNLKKLFVGYCMFSVIFNGLRKLQKLEYFSLIYTGDGDNNAIGILAESCPNLIHLVLYHGHWKEIVQYGFQNLGNLVNLEYLVLDYMKGINDDHFSSIAMKCKKLKHLNLHNCTGISNFGLEKLGSLMDLEYLNLGGIEHVDDSVISSITSNCLKLKELNLQGAADNVSKDALTQLSHRGVNVVL